MMRRSSREMVRDLGSANPHTANCKRESRTRGNGGPAAQQVFLGLIASLVVALPGYAQIPAEFRGNPFALGASGETEAESAGVSGASGAATLSIPIAVPPGPGGLAPVLSLNYSRGHLSASSLS